MWNPFRKKPKTYTLDEVLLKNSSPEFLEAYQKELERLSETQGDGKAVFFDEGYEAEAKDLEHEKIGLKAWYDRIRNL